MIQINNIDVHGFEAAIRGMRNPKNSWSRSDSSFDNELNIGENDLTLMKTLAYAGPEHGKYLRMITVTADITAPLYWWKEYDTYKVGTVADSCSTMHKIHDKEFVIDDFSTEHLEESSLQIMKYIIAELNGSRDAFNRTKEKIYWWQMIQILPTSYNQKRTVMLNYQVLQAIYHQRKNHKLDEWRYFCDHFIKSLPYAELITKESDL